jgi:high affinity Mn2+ porin
VKIGVAFLVLLSASTAWAAQDRPAGKAADQPDGKPQAPPPESPEDWSYHFQSTVVIQGRGGMRSLYSGPNSFSADSENATSITATLFLGRRLWDGGAIYFDPEISGGRGLSSVLGLAGPPNGETTRVGSASPKAYIARLYFEQTLALGAETEPVPPDQNQLAGIQPKDRITVHLGKMSATDDFDDNTYSHDARTQFLNWTLMSNGAWDYPADVRGYTYGGSIQVIMDSWALRYGLYAMPEEANGATFDRYIPGAHAQSLEGEYDYSALGMPGKTRVMAFLNNAHMGHYRETIDDPAFNLDITQSRTYTTKYGFTLNMEQKVADDVGLFLRAGWSNGATESFAFTEVDRTFQFGISVQGVRWQRPEDTVAAAVVVNGISSDHADYLAAGGLGFLLGDGALTYGRETIFEFYYSAKFFKSLFLSFDFQFVDNPGYNRDRGPISIFGLRVHVEF